MFQAVTLKWSSLLYQYFILDNTCILELHCKFMSVLSMKIYRESNYSSHLTILKVRHVTSLFAWWRGAPSSHPGGVILRHGSRGDHTVTRGQGLVSTLRVFISGQVSITTFWPDNPRPQQWPGSQPPPEQGCLRSQLPELSHIFPGKIASSENLYPSE